MEKQTLFSACLWREGSCGPRAHRLKQFQTRMSVCFSLERRRKTPKALDFSTLNILFWKVPCEEVEEMKKRLQECKMPFPSSDSKMGQPGWGWREASSGGGEGLVAEVGGGSRAGGPLQRFRFPSRPRGCLLGLVPPGWLDRPWAMACPAPCPERWGVGFGNSVALSL